LPDWKDWREKEMSVLRSMARERARKRMKALEMRKVNRGFSRLWRDYAGWRNKNE